MPRQEPARSNGRKPPTPIRNKRSRRGRNRAAKSNGAARKNDALARTMLAEQARERLFPYLAPACLVLAAALLIAVIALIASLNREERTIVVGMADSVADVIPLRIISQPMTPERVALWTNDVFDRLFEFSHANKEVHFRKVNIFFSSSGFAQFRQAMVASNWIQELDIRKGVYSGEVSRPLIVTRAGRDIWMLEGNVVVTLDAPGYRRQPSTKRVTVTVRRGDPASPVIAPDDPYPPTNRIGLRIEEIKML